MAGAALLLAACGGGADPAGGSKAAGNGGGASGGGDVKKASLAQPGAVTVAFCHPIPDGSSGGDGGKVYGLTVRSYSAENGAVLAERSTVLPSGVEPTAVCKKDGPAKGPGLAFNKDLTQVAGISRAGTTDRAAAFDLATGKEVSPPDPDAFTKRAKNTGAAFHPVTGRLWYDEQPHGFRSNDPVVSRDTKAGVASEQRVPYEKIPSLLRQDGPTATAVLATNKVNGPAVPAGGVVATSAASGGLRLARVSDKGEAGVDGYLTDLDTKGLGEDGPDCEPTFWHDATTLVCEFKKITVSADYKKVVKTEDLIPKNDRVSLAPLPSPDGKSFAFLSKGEGGQWALFRAGFTGGAQPVKIANVDQPLDGADKHRMSLVRWN